MTRDARIAPLTRGLRGAPNFQAGCRARRSAGRVCSAGVRQRKRRRSSGMEDCDSAGKGSTSHAIVVELSSPISAEAPVRFPEGFRTSSRQPAEVGARRPASSQVGKRTNWRQSGARARHGGLGPGDRISGRGASRGGGLAGARAPRGAGVGGSESRRHRWVPRIAVLPVPFC